MFYCQWYIGNYTAVSPMPGYGPVYNFWLLILISHVLGMSNHSGILSGSGQQFYNYALIFINYANFRKILKIQYLMNGWSLIIVRPLHLIKTCMFLLVFHALITSETYRNWLNWLFALLSNNLYKSMKIHYLVNYWRSKVHRPYLNHNMHVFFVFNSQYTLQTLYHRI